MENLVIVENEHTLTYIEPALPVRGCAGKSYRKHSHIQHQEETCPLCVAKEELFRLRGLSKSYIQQMNERATEKLHKETDIATSKDESESQGAVGESAA